MSLSNNRLTMRAILDDLYGDAGKHAFSRLLARLDRFRSESRRQFRRADELFNAQDIVVITYGDLLRNPDEPPLATLRQFFRDYLDDVVNTVHILPFYPYSSDDGFSVIDYTDVNPGMGSWEDIDQFQLDNRRVMFDAVINHISVQSDWFMAFKAGNPHYRDYFITVDPSTDLSEVVRPRALPLLTPFETIYGTEHVWTTFSADQVDLNYHNPATLLDVIDVLLAYIEHGADVIRLDAIAYLWKEVGTSCVHLPQTHAVIRLLRAILEDVAPSVLLITETNVPHDENVSYFGDGENEAHMVYNFSLPPLTAHALLTGSSRILSRWVAGLKTPSPQTVFFNFTASHDGVGIRPAAGILGADDLDLLLEHTRKGGGAVSSKTNSDGSTSPYELNITYFDLLNSNSPDNPLDLQVRRFLVSQAIMLELAGVPGIYMHSLLGSRNYTEGVQQTSHLRTINREKLDVRTVEQALNDPHSLRRAVFEGYRTLLEVRVQESAFHPTGSQSVLDAGQSAFALLRRSPDGAESILALNNIVAEPMTLSVPLPADLTASIEWTDLLSGALLAVSDGQLVVELAPYQNVWAKARMV